MQWRNTSTSFGTVSRWFHWLSAITVFGLFALGFWMVDLNYYSSWYRTAPTLHKSIGLLLLLVTVLRLCWRFIDPAPKALISQGRSTQLAAKWGHGLLYLGLLLVMLSGYLISTADGRPIEVFDWFTVPALLSGLSHQADRAGLVHEYAAWALVMLAIVHGLAALKHHFIDRDATLRRMLGKGGNS